MKNKRNLIPNILIVTEGDTEQKYLDYLRVRNSGYILKVCSSSDRSALGVVNDCKKKMKELDINAKRGDYIFCVFDVDENTEEQISNAIKISKKSGITIILSNPCFETFFLLHFTDNLPKLAPQGLKNEMKKYIKDYKEATDYWDILCKNKELALERSRSYLFDVDNFSLKSLGLGTNVYEIFDLTERLKKENAINQGIH